MLVEKQVLSTIIIYNKFELMPKVNPVWFKDFINLELWKMAVYCFAEYKKLDIELLKTWIYAQKHKQEIALINRLITLDEVYPSDFVIENLQEHYIKNCLTEYEVFIKNSNATVEAKKQLLFETYKKLNTNIELDESKNFYDNIKEYILNVLNEKITDKFNTNSIPLHNLKLKRLFGDFIRPWPIIIAGNPGFGKTSLMINLLVDIDRNKLPGLVFSFEDTIDTLRNKFISIKTGLNSDTVISNIYEKTEKDILARAVPSQRIFIIEKPCDMIKFRQIVDKHVITHGIKYIMIDYFQLFYGLKGLSKVEGLEMVAKEFVNIRKDYEIPIICLSQLSSDEGSKPFITDLKWCKGLGENARQVFVLYGNKESEIKNIDCVKNTFNAPFQTEIKFEAKTQRVTND